MTELLDGRLIIDVGDITKLKVDAIVNAANSSLMGGGGVDGAIHRAGGPAILTECKRIRQHDYPGGLPAGEAVITTGGNLPASFVIHTVGPVWKGGGKNEEKILYNAYYNSLTLSRDNGIKSIAFPAISTGVYGFPKDKAAVISLSAVRDFLKNNPVGTKPLPETVYFVFYSPSGRNIFLESISRTEEIN